MLKKDQRFSILRKLSRHFKIRSYFIFMMLIDSGTGIQVWGNINAPRAVTLSAIIYCLRSMVGHDIPLNQVNPLHKRIEELKL